MVVSVAVRMGTTFPLFVLPGDSLHLEYGEEDLFNDFNEILFSGAHKLENKLLYDLHNIFKYDIPNHFYFYNFSQSTFLNQIDSLEKVGKKFIHKAQEKHPKINPFFVVAMQQFVQFNIALYLENYPRINRMSFKKDEIEKSESYLQKEASFFEEDANLLNNSSYLNFVKNKTRNASYNIFRQKKITDEGIKFLNLDIQFSATESVFKNKDIQDYLKFGMLQWEMDRIGKDVKPYLEKYRTGNPAEYYLNLLDKEYIEFLEKFSREIILADYKFEDITGRICSLRELDGLVIYIDVWATWCGPCHRQRKYFEELMNFYKDEQDLVFVGISLDKPEEKTKWENMIKEDHIQGIQLFAMDGFQSQFAKDLNIAMIPRFIIIGKNGEIVQANASLPSAKNIHETLDEILKNSAESVVN